MQGAAGGDGGEGLDQYGFRRVYLRLGLDTDLRYSAFGAPKPDAGLRKEVFGKGTEHLSIECSEVEVDRAIELDVTVACFSFAEETGESEELEAAFPVGVSLLM